jgi:hypothetical protein
MTDISTYKLDAAFTSLAEFDHCAKPGDFIEVSLWYNGEGFDAYLNESNLSPAAQAVLDAYRDFSWRPDEEDNGRYYKWSHRAGIAAALRALAVRINGANAIRQDILDIADELEAQ